MTHQEVWFFDYRDIRIEIKCTHREPSPFMEYSKAWAFYLLLAVEQFPKELRPNLVSEMHFTSFGTPITPYDDNPLNALNWHCGMTFYEKRWNEDSVFKQIKVGCDYQHYWDDGRHDLYDVDFVRKEAEKCVDSLWNLYPNLVSMKTLWDEHRAKFPGATNPQ